MLEDTINSKIEITNIDFYEKKCHIHIIFNQYFKEYNEIKLKNIIIKLEKILKKEYGSNLNLIIQKIHFPHLSPAINDSNNIINNRFFFKI